MHILPPSFITALALAMSSTHPSSNNDNKQSTTIIQTNNHSRGNKPITILGFGSLLSEKSSRTTFPNLVNFRIGRIINHRRVFCHPASIFFQRNIANMKSLEISSLSAEYAEGFSFVCSVFEVPNDGATTLIDLDGAPSEAFREREEEFEIKSVPFIEINNNNNSADDDKVDDNGDDEEESRIKNNNNDDDGDEGILCLRSTDEAYIKLWGRHRFEDKYKKYGIDTIWGWGHRSGIRPCAAYLRHCVLAARNAGEECYESFLDETFLVDRTTTIREYLGDNPHVMTTLPPEGLKERYGG